MARPKGSKDKGSRTRFSDETKAVMAAFVGEFGATKTHNVLAATLGDTTPSIPTLCNIAAANGVELSRGPEIDLNCRDLVAALVSEVGLTGATNAMKRIQYNNGQPAMKVPSMVTLGNIAEEYGIELPRGRAKKEAA